MNTITIDPLKYMKAEAYAKKRNISIKALVENFFDQQDDSGAKMEERKYYISPKIASMRVGFKCPENSSFDYKSELRDVLTDRKIMKMESNIYAQSGVAQIIL